MLFQSHSNSFILFVAFRGCQSYLINCFITMQRKKYELPNVDGGSTRTIVNKKEKSTSRQNNTLDHTCTLFGQQKTTSRRERSPYQRSPYLECHPIKKNTFYNEKVRRDNYYIIKQGKTINFKDYIQQPRAKSSGRANSILQRRKESQKQRQQSFIAYGGICNDRLFKQSNSVGFNNKKKQKEVISQRSFDDRPAKQKLNNKKTFRRKCFIESGGTNAELKTALEDDGQVCLDQISTQQYRPIRATEQATLSQLKHLSQQTDNSLARSVTNYFNLSKQPQKINSSHFVKNVKRVSGMARQQVFIIQAKKIPQFSFTVEPMRKRRDDERNPILQPDSQDDF